MKYLPCARHLAKHFAYISLSKSYSKPTKWLYLLHFFRWRNWSLGSLNNLPKFVMLVSVISGLWTQVCLKPHTLLFNHLLLLQNSKRNKSLGCYQEEIPEQGGPKGLTCSQDYGKRVARPSGQHPGQSQNGWLWMGGRRLTQDVVCCSTVTGQDRETTVWERGQT